LHGPRRGSGRGAVLIALVVMLAATAATLSRPQAAHAVPCSAASVTITPLQSPDGTARPFYADFSRGSTNHSGYVGYELTGATLGSDVWVKLSGFTSAVGLAANQSGSIPVRATSTGGHPLVFAYLTASAPTTTAQSFNVEVWNGKPNQAGSMQVCTGTDGFSSVEDIINANANKITSISISNSAPAVGGSFDVTAVGDSGTLGSGLASDQSGGNGVLSMAPAMNDSWPADAFSLTGTEITIGGTTTRDKLRIYPPSTAHGTYTAKYSFSVRNTTSSATTVLPVQSIASGTQVKYTGSYPGTISQISAPSVTTSLVKSVQSLVGPPYHVTYQVVVSNSSTSSVVLDYLRDTPTPNGPLNWTFDSGSAKLQGWTIADPTYDASAGTLLFGGPFTVPANGTVTFRYSLSTNTSISNSVVGLVGAVTLGAASGSDNQVSIDPTSPAVTTSTLPNATVATSYSQTLTVSGGTPPYTWTLASGALPAGLSLNSSTGVISGTPTAAGSSTFTVTAADALARSGSKSLTVVVDGPAADTTPPTGSLMVNGGASTTSSASATLGLTASDDTGVVAYRVVEANDCSAASWVAVTPSVSLSTTTSLTLTGGDGLKTICAQYEDAAGNVSATSATSVTLDTVRPTLTLSSGASNPTNGTFSVAATFSESVTGFTSADVATVNGSLSGFAGSGASYSFTITPSADGLVAVDVADAGATDVAGNDSTAAQLTRTTDTVRPSVTLSTSAANPVTGGFTVDAVFSESVSGFDLSDVNVANGDASALAGAGANYAFTVTPTADGIVTVDVAAGAASDAAGNTSTAAAQLALAADVTRPSLTLATIAGNPTNGAFTVTATFSETVSGLDLSDVSVANGDASALAGAGAGYSFTVTPTADGIVTVDVALGAASDAAGNASAAAPQLSRTVDSLRPSVSLAAPAGPFNAPFSVTATFSESVTGFTAGDVSGGNATISSFAGSGDTYTFTVTPAGDGAVTVDVPGNVAADEAGNQNTAAATLTRTVDTVAPAVTLDAPAGPVKGSFAVKATFSKTVSGFTPADVTVVNGTVSGFTGSGSTYTFTITPVGDGAVTIDIAAGAAGDGAGNPSGAATQLMRIADLTPPAVTLWTSATNPTSGTFVVVATFSEAVTGFTAGDVTASRARLSGLTGSGSRYTFTVSPTGDGLVTVEIAADVASDAAGNGNVASKRLAVENDATPPTITFVTRPAATTVETAASLAFVADEAATFECSLDGASYAPCTSPATLEGVGVGVHTFSVRARDLVGNVSAKTIGWTVVKPTVDFASVPDDESAETVTITWTGNDPNLLYTCTLDSQPPSPCSAPFTLSNLGDGEHTFTVVAALPGGAVKGSVTRRWTTRRVLPKPDVVIVPKITASDLLGRPRLFKQSADAPHSNGPFTPRLEVTLDIPTPRGVDTVYISNHADFRDVQSFPTAADGQYDWVLLPGPSGDRAVYVRFEDAADAPVGQAPIVLDEELPNLSPRTFRTLRAARVTQAATGHTIYCGAAPRRWLRVAATDGFSGLNAIQIASNRAHPCAWRPFLSTVSYRLPGKFLYVRVEDRVGNISRWYRVRSAPLRSAK
jgi:hypothetical protein